MFLFYFEGFTRLMDIFEVCFHCDRLLYFFKFKYFVFFTGVSVGPECEVWFRMS